MGLWALYKSNPSSSSPFDVPRPSVSVPGKEKKRKGGEKKKKLIWVRPSRSTRSGIAADKPRVGLAGARGVDRGGWRRRIGSLWLPSRGRRRWGPTGPPLWRSTSRRSCGMSATLALYSLLFRSWSSVSAGENGSLDRGLAVLVKFLLASSLGFRGRTRLFTVLIAGSMEVEERMPIDI